MPDGRDDDGDDEGDISIYERGGGSESANKIEKVMTSALTPFYPAEGVQDGWFSETEALWPGQKFSLALEVRSRTPGLPWEIEMMRYFGGVVWVSEKSIASFF